MCYPRLDVQLRSRHNDSVLSSFLPQEVNIYAFCKGDPKQLSKHPFSDALCNGVIWTPLHIASEKAHLNFCVFFVSPLHRTGVAVSGHSSRGVPSKSDRISRTTKSRPGPNASDLPLPRLLNSTEVREGYLDGWNVSAYGRKRNRLFTNGVLLTSYLLPSPKPTHCLDYS